MNIEQIQVELSAMIKAMMAKGVVTPRAELCLRGDSDPMAQILSSLTHKTLDGDWLKQFTKPTIAEALDAAKAYIAALPDPETLVLRAYLGKLADAVDYGHENGIAAEYVDPVRITQKAMSDNLLTADAKAVA